MLALLKRRSTWCTADRRFSFMHLGSVWYLGCASNATDNDISLYQAHNFESAHFPTRSAALQAMKTTCSAEGILVPDEKFVHESKYYELADGHPFCIRRGADGWQIDKTSFGYGDFIDRLAKNGVESDTDESLYNSFLPTYEAMRQTHHRTRKAALAFLQEWLYTVGYLPAAPASV